FVGTGEYSYNQRLNYLSSIQMDMNHMDMNLKRHLSDVNKNNNNGNDGDDNNEPNKKKRRQVKRACLNCRIAHAACDNGRPCSRCVQYGLEVSCLDVERKNSKKKKENNGLGQLGTLAGINQLLVNNTMAPPGYPQNMPAPDNQGMQALRGMQAQMQHAAQLLGQAPVSQQSPLHQSQDAANRDIPHSVYMTHEYLPIINQLTAQHSALLQVIQQQMNGKTPSPSQSPSHQQYMHQLHQQQLQQQQSPYNYNMLPPIPPAVGGRDSAFNYTPPKSAPSPPRMLPPIQDVHQMRNNTDGVNPYGTNDGQQFSRRREMESNSPESPPARIFQPHLLPGAQFKEEQQQQQQNKPNTSTTMDNTFMDNNNEEINITTKNEDLSTFFIDDYFTKIIGVEEDVGVQSFGETDDFDASNYDLTQQISDRDRVVFPPCPSDEIMCVAVWELSGILYSANQNFLQVFQVPSNIILEGGRDRVEGSGGYFCFEDILPHNDLMFKPILKSLMSGITPSYVGPMQLVSSQMNRTGGDERIQGFTSCYMVRGGQQQQPRYLVTHISVTQK
ncbi:hypothetical protein AKO1_001049, partial [Acrasis kona]